MGKRLFIAEKPSVAQEFAKALKINGPRSHGYIESEDSIVTWCVGHLVTMSYPEVYDPSLKKWSLSTLPFIPEEFKYEVIPAGSTVFTIIFDSVFNQFFICEEIFISQRHLGKVYFNTFKNAEKACAIMNEEFEMRGKDK